jgi:hypothetical protein
MAAKILFFLIFILMPVFAYSQFERGMGLISGSGHLGFKQITTGGNGFSDNVFTFDINSRAGVFFRRGFAVGVLINTAYYTNYASADSRLFGNQLMIGPFIRYYFRNQIFMSFEGALGTGKDVFETGQLQGFERRKNLFYGSAGLGYAILVNRNVAFEPLLHFDGIQNINTQNVQDHFNQLRIRISLGITIFL